MPRTTFISDNASGVCPEALRAFTEACQGSELAYGEDSWTARARALVAAYFDSPDLSVFFVPSGTAANVLALAHLAPSFRSVVCHATAHIAVDECSAPEFFTGGKVFALPGEHGKLSPATVEAFLESRTDVHHPRPGILCLTQPTEAGTLYSPEELGDLAELAHAHGLRVFVDGARFANAQASVGRPARELTRDLGVDAMTLGGCKNGLPPTEAVVFFEPELAAGFEARMKQAGQLLSKMRFLTAPWVGALEGGAFQRHAAHANECARELADRLGRLPGVRVAHPTQANTVFLESVPGRNQALVAAGWSLLEEIVPGTDRIVCSWSTQQSDLDAIVAAYENLVV